LAVLKGSSKVDTGEPKRKVSLLLESSDVEPEGPLSTSADEYSPAAPPPRPILPGGFYR
jgi:hypothetical protein